MNSLPKTVTRQCRDCDLNPGPSAPESSMLTTWLPIQRTSELCQLKQHSELVSCCPKILKTVITDIIAAGVTAAAITELHYCICDVLLSY